MVHLTETEPNRQERRRYCTSLLGGVVHGRFEAGLARNWSAISVVSNAMNLLVPRHMKPADSPCPDTLSAAIPLHHAMPCGTSERLPRNNCTLTAVKAEDSIATADNDTRAEDMPSTEVAKTAPASLIDLEEEKTDMRPVKLQRQYIEPTPAITEDVTISVVTRRSYRRSFRRLIAHPKECLG